ncbi:MAG: hypothetical protein ACW98Y_08275 [Candidatus Thorarchaeota archaeon]|jgi:hypothetical protein
MIEIASLIIALLIVLTMGGMCFDWIGSGLVDPIIVETSPDTPDDTLEVSID